MVEGEGRLPGWGHVQQPRSAKQGDIRRSSRLPGVDSVELGGMGWGVLVKSLARLRVRMLSAGTEDSSQLPDPRTNKIKMGTLETCP